MKLEGVEAVAGATEHSIQDAIRRVLKDAGDKEGGRKRRQSAPGGGATNKRRQ